MGPRWPLSSGPHWGPPFSDHCGAVTEVTPSLTLLISGPSCGSRTSHQQTSQVSWTWFHRHSCFFFFGGAEAHPPLTPAGEGTFLHFQGQLFKWALCPISTGAPRHCTPHLSPLFPASSVSLSLLAVLNFPASISFSVSKAHGQTLPCSSVSFVSMATQSSLNSKGPA